MKKIAITGGIACGKSALLAELRKLGKKCIDCDDIAKSVYEMPSVRKELKQRLGTADRHEIAKIVFRDRKKKRALEEIIQPRILRKLKRELASAISHDLVFVEAPLLYEGCIEKLFDYVVVVRASRNMQIKRLLERGYSTEEATLRIKSQMPIRDKVRRADLVIDGEKNKRQLKRIAKEIIAKVRH
ncbi:MAG: dephospho-CoA kinase [Candidatus Diapherotrites archaeon]